MAVLAEVRLWGTRIGAVVQENIASLPQFNYDKDFLRSGIQVSPIMMPLSQNVFSFPGLANETFRGLPGLLCDSLPDRYGTQVLNSWLVSQGRDPKSVCAVERLLYTGRRGMGALEFYPVKDFMKTDDSKVDLSGLVQLASDILSQRENLHIKNGDDTMKQIISVGTSAGGARAKAVVAWNEATGDVRSGQVEAGKGYTYWLIKFDNVDNNGDHGDKPDGPAYTRIEYAYYLMACAAGINMSESRLYKENGAYHFMTKRFDRTDDGGKIHMQTLGALGHFDYNAPGAYSYEQASYIMNRLSLGAVAAKQFFRRMVFSVLAENRDDHVKNISFLMDKKGKWSLSPAYDVTYAYNPVNHWLAHHQMTINGKTDKITYADLHSAGLAMNVSEKEILNIYSEVYDVVSHWTDFAEKAMVPEKETEEIKNQLATHNDQK